MWWTLLAWADPPALDTSGKPEGPLPGEPQGCRDPAEIKDALESVMKPLRACLRGASFRPMGPAFTIAPEGTVTIETNTDNPARDVCANEAIADLRLSKAECTVIVSYPMPHGR